MNATENLWNDDELLNELERMQDQVEELLAENRNLRGSFSQAQQMISEHSLTISELKSTLQSKSEKIVELNGQLKNQQTAERVLRENRELKNRNQELSRENIRIKEKAEQDEQVYQELSTDLIQREERLRSGWDLLGEEKENLEHKVQFVVRKTLEQERQILERGYADMKRKYEEDCEEKYKMKQDSVNRIWAQAVSFTILPTIIAAFRNSVWLQDMKSFLGTIWKFIVLMWLKVQRLLLWLFSKSGWVESDTSKAVAALVTVFLLLAVVALVVRVMRWFWYKKESPKLSQAVALEGIITVLITVYLGDILKNILPVNLIIMNVILFIAAFLIQKLICMKDKEQRRRILIWMCTFSFVAMVVIPFLLYMFSFGK